MAGNTTDTPQFFLLHADATDDRVALAGTNVSIGRDAECDVSLDDPKVSSRHCNLMWHGDSWRIVDLDSRNGVRVNGRQVSAGRLASGDLIQVGPRRLFFWQDGQPIPKMDAATEEAARQYDESLNSAASDRRVEVDGVDGALTDEPAGSTAGSDSATEPAPDAEPLVEAPKKSADAESADESSANTTDNAAAAPATTDGPTDDPAPADAGSDGQPQSLSDSAGIEFADDSRELQLSDNAPTPESLAKIATTPVALPTRPTPAAAPVAATSTTPTARSAGGRRSRPTLTHDIARALPVLTFAFGLLAFAGGLLFWLNGGDANGRGAGSTDAASGAREEPELGLLRTRVSVVASDLEDLRQRRAALESELAEPGHEDVKIRLDRYSEESKALTARLRDLESRLSTLLDRVDQLESSLRRYESGDDGN